jgi:hypothetical protein
MPYKKCIVCRSTSWGIACGLLFTLGSSNALAQAKQLLTWKQDIAYLQSASEDELTENRIAIEQIRSGINFTSRVPSTGFSAILFRFPEISR